MGGLMEVKASIVMPGEAETPKRQLGEPRPDCDHWDRYRAIGGWERCETCAKLDDGWTACTLWGCEVLTPKDMRRCDEHGGKAVVGCRDCDEGYVLKECENCDGLGEIDTRRDA